MRQRRIPIELRQNRQQIGFDRFGAQSEGKTFAVSEVGGGFGVFFDGFEYQIRV